MSELRGELYFMKADSQGPALIRGCLSRDMKQVRECVSLVDVRGRAFQQRKQQMHRPCGGEVLGPDGEVQGGL